MKDEGWSGFWAEAQAVDWADYPVPADPINGPYNTVEEALVRLLAAEDREQARSASYVMLDAVGHNHSGSLFAVVVPAVPFLIRIAVDGPSWARFAALEVMLDVVSWLNWTGDRRRSSPTPLPSATALTGAGLTSSP